jgi:Alpha-L-arabinofuranosidase B (ABFB) domain
MFRALEGYLDTPWGQFQTNQTQLSTTPMIASTVTPPADINKVATGINQIGNVDIYTPAKFYATQLADLNAQNNACLNASTIGDLIKLNQSGPLQCGWYYNKDATGLISQRGYLSTSKGPVQGLSSPIPTQPYTLYFGNNTSGFSAPNSTSLQAGQEKIDTDVCNACGASCGNCTQPNCGYCTTSLKYIPITANNQAKYPYSLTASCGSTNIVTNASQCPPTAPAPTFNPYNNVSATGVPLGIIRTSTAITASACAPDANGRLSGACLQTALQTAGCTPQGSLSLALNGFSSTTNISSIANNNPNIATYASISPSFNLQNFLTSPSITAAGTEAQKLALANQTAKTAATNNPSTQTKDNTLAIDLCTKRGYFLDNFNFCSELTPTTPKPTAGWDIACLQQAFLAAGLTTAGTMYPNAVGDDAYKYYSTLSPWSAVTDYMANLYTQIYKGGMDGFKGHIEGFETATIATTAASAPFMLESYNFRKYYVTYRGVGAQPSIQQGTGTNSQFTWKAGVLPGTINIFPVANPGTVFAVRNNTLFTDVYSANDEAQQKNAAFIVREGNVGKSLISFESVATPGNFLRHAGFVFWCGPRSADNQLLNEDSTFQPMDIKGANLTSSFFQSLTTPNPSAKIYPGQASAVEKGWGLKVDPPKTPLTIPGMEFYTFVEVKGSMPNQNVFVLSRYGVVGALPPQLNGLVQIYVLSNYVTQQDQSVAPTITMGTWNQMSYSVNSYSTGWGWQWTRNPDIIDAQPNTFPPMNILSKYTPQTKNMRILTSDAGDYKGNAFQLKANVPNIVRNHYIGGADIRRFNFKVNGPIAQMTVRDKNAPFMRFEPFKADLFYPTTRFTEMRAPEIANVIVDGPPIQFQERGTKVLTSPGTSGYAQFNGNQARIVNVDYDAWGLATLAFCLTSIPSCTAASPCNLLRIGNVTWGTPAYGYMCGIYGSSNNNIQLAVYTMSKGNTIMKTSVPVKLLVNTWYMLSISSNTVTVYAIDMKSNLTSVAGTIVLDPTITIKPIKAEPNLGPLIQIGDLNTSLNLNVAWLHLFDVGISTVDPNKELIGYGTGGYETGLF